MLATNVGQGQCAGSGHGQGCQRGTGGGADSAPPAKTAASSRLS